MNRKRSIRKSCSNTSINSQINFKYYKPRNRKSIKTTNFDNVSSESEDKTEGNIKTSHDNYEFDFNIVDENACPDNHELNSTNDNNISIIEKSLSNVSFNEEMLNTSNSDSNFNYSESEDTSRYKKLHKYSNITVAEASFVLSCFKTRFSLSDVCLNNMIKLINAFLPHENNLPRNIKELNDIVISQNQKIHTEIYCISCSALLTQNKKCPSNKCSYYNKVNKIFNTFQYLTIEPQIINLITVYYKEIKQYNRESRGSKDLAHTEYNKSRHLHDNHLNLILYTDGVQLTKNNKHFWPVILSIVELPKNIRDTKRNKVIAGCWYGCSKPTSDILFQNLIKELDTIKNKGVNININGKDIKYFVSLEYLLVDSPAKSMCLNIKQFNGYFGCPYCFNYGKLF